MKDITTASPFGYQIARDEIGRISLTDIYKAAGSPSKKDPSTWQQRDSAIELITTVCQILNTPKEGVLKSKRGKHGGGTFGHKQIALAYAKYLDPKLHVAVNQIFFERLEEEKNPDLILNRAVETYKKKGKTEDWIGERLKGKAARLNFTKTLSVHGVSGIGFGNCTNAIYKPLWGGDAKLVRNKKGLPEKSNTRESMSKVELAAVGLAELLAANNIEKLNIYGNAKCEAECFKTGNFVAQAVINSQKNLPQSVENNSNNT